MAPGLAINTLNGKSSEFVAVLDSGADQTTLTQDLLDDLEIDPLPLQEIPIGGAEGIVNARYCEFLRIGLLEFPGLRKHFPNGLDPVPVHFSRGPFNLLGRQAFLNLCKVTFDGPNQTVLLEF
jgi:hypothetical protein